MDLFAHQTRWLTPTPEKTPASNWLTEARELFDLLRHATDLLDACQEAQWQRPYSKPPAVPGRGVVGAYSDPTGDTVADTRRIDLREAVDNLVHDPARHQMWHDLRTDGDKLLANIGHPHHYRPRPIDPWRTQRDTMLAHLAQLHGNLAAIADSQAKPLGKLTRDLRRANSHLEQHIRRLVKTYNRFSDDSTGELWVAPAA